MAKKTYLVNRSILGLAFNMMFTAAAIYRIDVAQLTITQLILTGTALEIAVFLFETPTGVVADLKSRRLSVIIGTFVIGIGFTLEALTTLFGIIFLAQIILGLGWTFISGALDSWLSDETQNVNVEQNLISGAQVYGIMSIIGIVFAAVVGSADIRIAMFVSAGLVVLLGVYDSLFMTEEHFHKTPHEGSIWQSYVTQLTSGFSHMNKNRVLRVMFVIILFFGLYSEGIDRTYEFHILTNLTFRSIFDVAPIWILSTINGLIAVFGFVLLQVTKKYVTKRHHLRVWLFTFVLVMIVGVLLFGFLPQPYLAVSAFLLFHAAREGTHPLLNAMIIRNTPSKIKATVLSAFGQLDAIGQLLSGLIMVTIGALIGLHAIYLVTAILLLVPLVLVPLASNRHTEEEKNTFSM